MNKQELIESISHLPSDCSRPRPMIDKLTASELIKLLDEPQKVAVPQFVDDFITEQKKLAHTLSYSIDACMIELQNGIGITLSYLLVHGLMDMRLRKKNGTR